MKPSDLPIGIMVGIPFNTDILLFLINSDGKIDEFVLYLKLPARAVWG